MIKILHVMVNQMHLNLAHFHYHFFHLYRGQLYLILMSDLNLTFVQDFQNFLIPLFFLLIGKWTELSVINQERTLYMYFHLIHHDHLYVFFSFYTTLIVVVFVVMFSIQFAA